MQLRGKYVGGHRIRISEESFSLCIDETTRPEDRGDRPSTPKSCGNDLIKIVIPFSNPRPVLLSITTFFSISVFLLPHPSFFFPYIIHKRVRSFCSMILPGARIALGGGPSYFAGGSLLHVTCSTCNMRWWPMLGWLGVRQVVWHICAPWDIVPI